jgi:hypothetical protein
MIPLQMTMMDAKGAQHWTSKVQSKTAESFSGFAKIGSSKQIPYIHWLF